MTSASYEKWRPFNCFFIRVGLRTYQHPCGQIPMLQRNLLSSFWCKAFFSWRWRQQVPSKPWCLNRRQGVMHNNLDTVFSNIVYRFLRLRKATGNCHAPQIANRCPILRFVTFYRGFQEIQLTDRCPWEICIKEVCYTRHSYGLPDLQGEGSITRY